MTDKMISRRGLISAAAGSAAAAAAFPAFAASADQKLPGSLIVMTRSFLRSGR